MSIVLSADNSQYLDLLNEAAEAFPLKGEAPTVERYGEPDMISASGIHDLIGVTISPALISVLVGAGALVAASGAKKFAELAAQDFYSWLKDRIFRKACKRFADSKHHPETQGLKLHLFPEEDKTQEQEVEFVWSVRYEHRPGQPFDEAELNREWTPFDLITLPAISRAVESDPVRGAIVQGFLGPGAEDPQWIFDIRTKPNAIMNLYPTVSTSGFIDWDAKTTKYSSTEAAEELRKVLSDTPPFVVGGNFSEFHWRNCKNAPRQGTPSTLLDHEAGLNLGLRACRDCIAEARYPVVSSSLDPSTSKRNYELSW